MSQRRWPVAAGGWHFHFPGPDFLHNTTDRLHMILQQYTDCFASLSHLEFAGLGLGGAVAVDGVGLGGSILVQLPLGDLVSSEF